MKKWRVVLILGVVSALSATAQADTVWTWSFNGQAGTYTTDGLSVGGTAAPGTYNLLDFSVTSSTAGEQLGSVSGGQYNPSGFATGLPYSFQWNGSAVTEWDKTGLNTFNWWVFQDNSLANVFMLFGWATGNINDPASAAVYNGVTGAPLAEGPVTVSVETATAVPEPSSLALLLVSGLLGVGYLRRRKDACTAA